MKIVNWLGLISSLSAHSIRHKSLYSDRIINGYDVEPAFKYTWMVAIMERGRHWCGGILLTEKIVLTAAHCILGEKETLLKSYKAHLHRHDLDKEPDEENSKVLKISDFIVHPGYDAITFYNDTIFVLNTTANAHTHMQLDTSLKHKEGMGVSALGWGRTEMLGGTHPILQELPMPTYNDDECVEEYLSKPSPYKVKPETQICAGFSKGGKDTCGGDSGGPLFAYIQDKPTLIGIVSYGGGICAQPRTPGVYTRIGYYRKWILEVIQKYN